MKEAIRQAIWSVTIAIILLAMLVIGSFKDLAIAEAICLPGNTFSVLTDSIAKLPAFLIMMAACGILLKCAYNKECNIVLKRLYIIAYFILGVVSATFAFIDCFQLIFAKRAYYISVSLVCGVFVFLLFLNDLSKHRRQEYDRYKKWAITACIIVGVVAAVSYGMKIIWKRASYIDVTQQGAQYSPWYKIVNVDGGWAMPDNKTALAFTTWALMTLTKIHPRLANKVGWMQVAINFFIVLVIIGSLFSGKYFLSDVAIGGIIGYATTKTAKVLAFGAEEDRTDLSENNLLGRIL
ncbi:MAG: hypothetical protein ACI4MO_00865 [Christensenellales bacterium]